MATDAASQPLFSLPVVGPVTRRSLLVWTLVVNAELAAVVAYFAFTDATLSSPLFTLYGLLWVDAALLVFARYDLPEATGSRAVPTLVAAGYGLLLFVFGGVVGPSTPVTPLGWDVSLLPPGWGPAVVYGGQRVAAVVMPAKVLGYGALVYLLYGSLLEASRAGLAGLLGLFSCVSCSFPILAGAVAATVGGGGVVAALVTGVGYGPSTAVFLVSLALLWWRPGFATLRRLRG
ncbi:hypothetical protein RYH80_09685 [Halobaculum sp. MBLA0147]|uniref:DUF7546 family protein n=1 Tax=Halobaculum sp. MBLA0147 TaxID=3079934 RepID=UPI003525F228